MISQKSKNQNIDRMIQGIRSIIRNRCSLLDEEVNLLNEVVAQLEKLKQKDKADVDLIIKVVELLLKFFLIGDDIMKFIGKK